MSQGEIISQEVPLNAAADSDAAAGTVLLERRASWVRVLAVPALILIAIVAVAFGPAVRGDLLQWDDQHNILLNPHLNPLSAEGLLFLWTHPFDRLYVPLFYTSFVPDHLFSGAHPAFVHSVNIALHALAAVVLMNLLLQVFLPAGERLDRAIIGACALASALFALHPLQAEPVAWATGRKDVLSGLLTLTAMWQYFKWRREGLTRQYWIGFAAFALAVLTKPAATAAPLAVFAIDVLLHRRRPLPSVKALLPWIAVALALAIGTALLQTPQPDMDHPSYLERVFVAGDAILWYLRKLFWPTQLGPVYGITPKISAVDTSALIEVAAVLVLLVAAFWRKGVIAAAVAVFLAFLLPVLGFVPFDYQRHSIVADRYMYLPLVGVALGIAGGVRFACTRSALMCKAVSGALLLVAIAFIVLSHFQTRVWKTSETLWTHAVKVAPNSAIARNSMGMVYGSQMKPAEAEREFLAAIEANPKFAIAHNNLANVYEQTGKPELSLKHLEQAVAADPGFVIARANLALSHAARGNNEAAVQHARQALKLHPDLPTAWLALVQAMGQSGKGEQALQLIQQRLKENPQNTELRQLEEQVKQILSAP